jgi:predicted nucleic acid-binding Zn ribbon protein
MSHAAYRLAQDVTSRPQPIKEVLAELIARRGYAREQSGAAFQAAWQAAAGEFLAGHTRCGNLRRGVLEVAVSNSILMQEITFRKASLLKELTRLLPDSQITDIKLRIGAVQ